MGLVARREDARSGLHSLARLHGNFAILLAGTKRADDAEKHYRHAIALLEEGKAKLPVVPSYQRVLIDNLVWAFRLGELNSCRFPLQSYEFLGKAVGFMLRFCDPQSGKMLNSARRIVASAPDFSWGWSAVTIAAGAATFARSCQGC